MGGQVSRQQAWNWLLSSIVIFPNVSKSLAAIAWFEGRGDGVSRASTTRGRRREERGSEASEGGAGREREREGGEEEGGEERERERERERM
eukprot:3761529-Rhodomonas_salina.1